MARTLAGHGCISIWQEQGGLKFELLAATPLMPAARHGACRLAQVFFRNFESGGCYCKLANCQINSASILDRHAAFSTFCRHAQHRQHGQHGQHGPASMAAAAEDNATG